jgi:ligand-binding sensor domain-containing protein
MRIQANVIFFTLTFILSTQCSYSQNPEWMNLFYCGSVVSIAQEGNFLWAATGSYGMMRLNKTNGEKVFYTETNSELPSNYVNSIAVDNNGHKWIGTDEGLAMYDDTVYTVYPYNPSDSWIAHGASSVAVDHKGNIWFAFSYRGGLVKYDGSSLTGYTGLPENRVTAIAVDGEGNKWIGMEPGLAMFDDSIWTVYHPGDYAPVDDPNRGNYGYLSCIAIDSSGNKWFGTWGGLFKYDGITWTVFNSSNSELHGGVYSLAADDNGNIWVGTTNGLAKYDGTAWTTYNTSNSGIPGNWIYAISIDDSGNKWVGAYSNGGLAKFDGRTWTVYVPSNSELPSNYISSIAIDHSGNKWLGTYGGGVVKYDGSTWTVYKQWNSGLPSDVIYSITIDNKGNKWICSDGGLVKYNDSIWTVYDTTNNSSWGPLSMAIDHNGDIWVASKGLWKYDGSTWTVYTPSNSGLPQEGIRAIAIDDDGNKWQWP